MTLSQAHSRNSVGQVTGQVTPLNAWQCVSTKQNSAAFLVSSCPEVSVQPFCESDHILTGVWLTETEQYRILGAQLKTKSSGKSTCIKTMSLYP